MARPKTLEKPKVVTVKLPGKLHRAVRFLAADIDSDISKIVRAALENYVTEAGPEFEAILKKQCN